MTVIVIHMGSFAPAGVAACCVLLVACNPLRPAEPAEPLPPTPPPPPEVTVPIVVVEDLEVSEVEIGRLTADGRVFRTPSTGVAECVARRTPDGTVQITIRPRVGLSYHEVRFELRPGPAVARVHVIQHSDSGSSRRRWDVRDGMLLLDRSHWGPQVPLAGRFEVVGDLEVVAGAFYDADPYAGTCGNPEPPRSDWER